MGLKYFSLSFLLSFAIMSAQKITLISKATNKALPNVLVFDKEGNIITKSAVDGTIDRRDVSKEDYYLLSHNNVITDTLKIKDLSKDSFVVSDKMIDIKPIVLEKKEGVKEYFLKGYFISYVLMNGKLNCYSDGIIIYKIDKQENKVGSSYISQYRAFTLKDPQQKFKSVGSFDLKTQMKVPQIEILENLQDVIKTDKYALSENSGQNFEELSLIRKNIDSKEVNFLGYSMTNFSREINCNYMNGAEIKNYPFSYLDKFSNTTRFNMKHKSEDKFNDITLFTEFYPISISYSKPTDDVSFSKNKSNYREAYWEDSYFPKTLELFSSFFKKDLEEQKNTGK